MKLVIQVNQTNRIMATSKEYLYGKQARKTSRIADALSHPARLVILQQLQKGDQTFSHILESHPLNRASLSQHLRTLRLAGLIDYTTYGTSNHYTLNYDYYPQWVKMMLSGLNHSEALSIVA